MASGDRHQGIYRSGENAKIGILLSTGLRPIRVLLLKPILKKTVIARIVQLSCLTIVPVFRCQTNQGIGHNGSTVMNPLDQ